MSAPPLTYPRWISPGFLYNLREVGPDLYVGSKVAVASPPPRREWAAWIDVHGDELGAGFSAARETAIGKLRCPQLRWPFHDGYPIPEGLLDAALAIYQARRGPVLVSCAAGISRSVSVAYALVRALERVGHQESLSRCQESPRVEPSPYVLESARRWVEARPVGPVVLGVYP